MWGWYLPYIKGDKKILQTIDPFQTLKFILLILKNKMQKTLGLVTIIGEHQSDAIKNFIVHILSTICVIIDESNKMNKNLSVISLELILSFLLCICSDIETQ